MGVTTGRRSVDPARAPINHYVSLLRFGNRVSLCLFWEAEDPIRTLGEQCLNLGDKSRSGGAVRFVLFRSLLRAGRPTHPCPLGRRLSSTGQRIWLLSKNFRRSSPYAPSVTHLPVTHKAADIRVSQRHSLYNFRFQSKLT